MQLPSGRPCMPPRSRCTLAVLARPHGAPGILAAARLPAPVRHVGECRFSDGGRRRSAPLLIDVIVHRVLHAEIVH